MVKIEKDSYRLFLDAMKKDQPEEAVHFFELGQRELLQKKDYEGLGNLYTVVVEYFHNANVMEQAIYYGTRYCNLVDGGTVPVSVTYYIIRSSLEFFQEDYMAALANLRNEAAYYTNEDQLRAKGSCLSNIGVLEIMSGQYAEALNTLIDSKMLLQKCNEENSFFGMRTKMNIAWAYLELKDMQKAKLYLEEVLNWPDIDSVPMLKVELYTNFGRYHKMKNEDELAIDFFLEAVDLCHENNNISELTDLYKMLSEEYEIRDDYKSSNHYLKMYAEMYKERSKQVQRLIRLKAEAEINLYQKEKVVKAYRDKRLSLVRQWEYDILTNTFSKKFLMNHIDGLLNRKDKMPHFSLLLIAITNMKELASEVDRRALEGLQVDVGVKINNLGFDRQIAARINDGAFVICYEELPLSGVKEQARELLDALKELDFEKGHRTLRININAGIVQGNTSAAKDSQDLLRMLSLALYQAESTPGKELVVW